MIVLGDGTGTPWTAWWVAGLIVTSGAEQSSACASASTNSVAREAESGCLPSSHSLSVPRTWSLTGPRRRRTHRLADSSSDGV